MGPVLGRRTGPWPPTFMGICSELENLSVREEPQPLAEEDMPRHSTCKRSALCPLSPQLHLRRVNLEVNDIYTVFHDWLSLPGWPEEGLRGAIVNAGGGKEGKGPTLPPHLALPIEYLWERDLQVAAAGAVRMLITFTGSCSNVCRFPGKLRCSYTNFKTNICFTQ